MSPRPATVLWPPLTVVVSLGAAALVAWAALHLVDLPGPSADPAEEPVRVFLELTGSMLLAGLVALVLVAGFGLVLWAIGIVWGARRLFPAGRRLVPALATLGTALLGSWLAGLAVGAASSASGGLGEGWYLAAVGLAFAASCAVFPWWDVRSRAVRA